MENNELFSEFFDGKPMEHLVKILQSASPMAINNVLSDFFEQYIIQRTLLESNNIDLDIELNEVDLRLSKSDLAIDMMSKILSQE